MRHSQHKFCAIFLLLLAGASHAADSAYPAFGFNAYGTLGAVHSSEDQADFVNGATQAEGAGASQELAFGVDSRLAVQLTTSINPKLTAVVQVITEQRYDNSYTPSLEWANIKYDFTPDFSLRAGRIVLPSFIVSDYRKVGFANYWVRPPLEVYNMVPITNSDGLDASYRFQHGALTNTIHAFAGSKNIRLAEAGTWKAREIAGVISTVGFGDSLLRAGYIKSKLSSTSVSSLLDLFRQFGARGNAIADRYNVEDKQIEALVLGGRYDPGDWFALAEWVRTASPSFLGTDRAWYVAGGYRLGQLTPYASYSRKNSLGSPDEPGLNVAPLPLPLQEFASALNGELAALLNSNNSSTLTLGTRWDFMDDLSFKLQIDHMRLDKQSRADLTRMQPGFRPGGALNVISATVDFVF